jgi:hypothetical protein
MYTQYGMRATVPDRLPSAGEIYLPAYRCSSKRLLVRCPWCDEVHSHGDTGGAIERRGSHCIDPCPLAHRGYALIIVGRVASWRMVPRLDPADAVELSEVLRARFHTG